MTTRRHIEKTDAIAEGSFHQESQEVGAGANEWGAS